MAITSVLAPDTWSPVYNRIRFIVDSDNKTQCSMEYIADIYINGAFQTRLKLFPNAAGQAEFKINKVLQDYILNNPLNTLSLGVSSNSQSHLSYQVKFGEAYDTSLYCDAGQTIFPNLLVSSTYHAFNAALDYSEWLKFNVNDFFPANSTKRFLTNQPANVYIGETSAEKANLAVFNPTSSSLTDVRVRTYDAAGTILNTYTLYNAYNNPTSTGDYIVNFACGVEDLNTLHPGLIDASVYSYDVTWLNNNGGGNILYNGTMTNSLGGWPSVTLTEFGATSTFGLVSNQAKFVAAFDSPDLTLTNSVTTLTAGFSYNYSIDVVSLTSPYTNIEIYIKFGNTLSSVITTTGTHTGTIACTGDGKVKIIVGTDGQGGTAILDNFTIAGKGPATETKTFTIDRRCTTYEPVRFCWLGRLGAYDSYSFNLRKNRKVGINKTEYTQMLPSLAGVFSDTDYGLRGRTTLSVNAKDQFEVTSNWVSEEEGLWLEELFTSPDVYIIKDNGDMQAVIITSTTYEETLKKHKKMISYKIEYEYAFNKNIQNN